jgi:hypothetical protein
MEGVYHGQRQTTWFLCKVGVTPSDIQPRLSAVCDQKVPACSSVFSWYGASAVARKVHSGWYRSTPEEWLSEVIRKVSRRRQRCITWEGNILSQQLFGIQHKGNKIVANEARRNRFLMPIVQNIFLSHITPSIFGTE